MLISELHTYILTDFDRITYTKSSKDYATYLGARLKVNRKTQPKPKQTPQTKNALKQSSDSSFYWRTTLCYHCGPQNTSTSDISTWELTAL